MKEELKPNLNLSQMSLNSSVEQLEVALRDMFQQSRVGMCRGEPITQTGKKKQLVKMMTLVLVPILVLVGVSLFFLAESVNDKFESDQLHDELEFGIRLGRFIHALERERDMSAFYLSRIGPDTKTFLLARYPETDNMLLYLEDWPVDLDTQRREHFHKKGAFQRYLNNHRNQLGLHNITVYEEIQFYTDMIDVLTSWVYNTVNKSRYGFLWKTLVAFQKIVISKQSLGIERALGTTYFAVGGFPTPRHYESYNRYYHQFKRSFRSASQYSALVQPFNEFEARMDGEAVTKLVKHYRVTIRNKNVSAPSQKLASSWFDAMTIYIEQVNTIQQDLTHEILARLNDNSAEITTDLAVSTVVLVVVIMLCPVVLRAVYRLTKDIQTCALTLADKTRELNREKRRTDSLLHQMLPREVADQLKKKKNVTAEYYKEVSIFFSDVVGFSRICVECQPMQIVTLLNTLYTLFDERISHHDVYKVETIGDSYMVASGVPIRMGHRHASAIADMALDLLSCCSDIEVEVPRKSKIRLRIGIHSGPCVAGVVGSKMPRYCLFGDTVNTASRMETHGLPNRIHVSQQSYRLMNKVGGYIFQIRGSTQIKGKGKMVTYWLIGRDASHVAPGRDSGVDSSANQIAPSTSAAEPPSQKTNVEQFCYDVDEDSIGDSVIEIRRDGSAANVAAGNTSVGETMDYTDDLGTALPKPQPAPKTPPTLEELEKQFQEHQGSPPIVQLTEGVHF